MTIYFIYNSFSAKSETALIFLTLQNNDSIDYNTVLFKNIEEEIKNIESKKVFIYFYKQDGYAQGIEIKQKSGIADKNYLLKKIDSTLASISQFFDNSLNSEQLKTKFEAFLTKINQLKKENKQIIAVIAGSFPYPICVNEKTINQIIALFDSSLKELDRFSLIWNVCSNSDRTEQKLLNHLKGKFNIIDKNIILPLPPCTSNLQGDDGNPPSKFKQSGHLSFLISSSFDEKSIKKMTNKIDSISKLFDTLNIRILTTDKSDEYVLLNEAKDKLKEDIAALLHKTNQSDMDRLKFMFDNIFKSFEKSNFQNSYIFLAGSEPSEVKRIYQFKGQKKVFPKIFLMFRPDKFQTILQNALQDHYEFETIN